MLKMLPRARRTWSYVLLAAGLLVFTYFVITPVPLATSEQAANRPAVKPGHPAHQVTRNLGGTCDFSKEFELRQLHRSMGVGGRPVRRTDRHSGAGTAGKTNGTLFYTYDDWPQFPQRRYNHPIPKSPHDPVYSIQWDFDTASFLKRPDVKGRPPKLITFVVPMGYLPSIPEPVRLRTCPEMPCRVTTNSKLINSSAALVWNAPEMKKSNPPKRTNPDQVFVFHNQERQVPSEMPPFFRSKNWRSVFNWTMSYRYRQNRRGLAVGESFTRPQLIDPAVNGYLSLFSDREGKAARERRWAPPLQCWLLEKFDSDILDVYGYLARSPNPRARDYLSILSKKTHMIATFISHCPSDGRREKYLKMLQKQVLVHVYGACGRYKCARSDEAKCIKQVETKYKFYLAFENSICPDYVTEKFFHFLATDMVVVARGGTGYEKHAPPGTFINVDDFKSVEELADYLLYLDLNPYEYLKILLAKDCFVFMYEEYPHRHSESGKISFMHYHYEAVAMCEMCRRLWNLDAYRKTIPDVRDWYDKGNCLPPKDLY